uniref:Uncharacterized protein n=1 Tax=Triticum urartu TaxID=4572 RepID=A0A8R7U0F6_TRIUA
MRLLLPDKVRGQGSPGVLRRPRDGDHHGHELLPRRPLPLRPQRHCFWRHGQGRPQRRAPPRRHHRHAVQEGAVPVPGAVGDVPRGEGVEPELPGDPGGVRERRRRRGAGGPHGRRRADGGLEADEALVGLHLAPGHAPPAAGALLAARHQRLRQVARRRPGHPRRLAGRRRVQLRRPVR